MSFQAESFCRDKRLFDVRRGVVYLRQTDNMAQRQWRHYGTVPAIKTHVIRDIGVTTRLPDVIASRYEADQSWTDTKDSETEARGTDSDVRGPGSVALSVEPPRSLSKNKNFVCKTTVLEDFGSSQQPQISVTEVTDRTADPTPEPDHPQIVTSPHHPSVCPPSEEIDTSLPLSTPQADVSTSYADTAGLSSRSGMLPSLPPFVQPASTSKHDQHSFRECYPLPEEHTKSGQFNTWGSRTWAVDSKLEPDPCPPQTKSPKHYPPMSRVADMTQGKNRSGPRQLRTLTDFRSRNGTVRIIRPLPPLTDSKKPRVSSSREQEVDLDLPTLDREQTYAMLKRIDLLLDPSRAYFTSDLASSQREECSSTLSASDLTESLPDNDQHDRRQCSVQHGGHVQVHKDYETYFGDFTENGANGSGEREDCYADRLQRYTSYMEDRLRRFYGNVAHLPDRSQGRFHHLRGHSEPPRERPRFLSEIHKQNYEEKYFHEKNISHGKTKAMNDSCETTGPETQNGSSHPRQSLVVKQSSRPVWNQENCSRQSSRLHSHSHQMLATKWRRNGVKTEGEKRRREKGWRSLREVLDSLEENGIDLHLKCQKWITNNFP